MSVGQIIFYKLVFRGSNISRSVVCGIHSKLDNSRRLKSAKGGKAEVVSLGVRHDIDSSDAERNGTLN